MAFFKVFGSHNSVKSQLTVRIFILELREIRCKINSGPLFAEGFVLQDLLNTITTFTAYT